MSYDSECETNASYTSEFSSVELLRQSLAETRAVDAFALALIKSERQMRKLVTYLVFQYPDFSADHVKPLREALNGNRNVYFEGFIRGFDAIYEKTLKDIVGGEYDRLFGVLQKATKIRNKIFHGQLTDQYLSREDLLSYVDDISEWCRLLAEGGTAEIGYDGFGRNSFRKLPPDKAIHNSFKTKIESIDEYSEFIRTTMSGHRR